MKFVLACCIVLQASCGSRSSETLMELRGPAMGTSYQIKVVQPPQALDRQRLRGEVDRILTTIDNTFSTYDVASELSRLNRDPSRQWLPISSDMHEVLRAGQLINQRSHGAFDVTVGPLVDLWGFGPQFRPDHVPSQAAIQHTLSRVGARHLQLRAGTTPALKRSVSGLEIDLNALVPGYAADQIAARLEQWGVRHYLVDMGGELRLRGHNPDGGLWQLAIEKPEAAGQHFLRRLQLTDAAVSTSGSYKNLFEINGKRYSHEIDPRTGYPVSHDIASVTVVAETAMEADAWSTALLVLGPIEGMKIAEQEHIAALFVAGEATDGRRQRASSSMTRYLSD